MLSAKELAALLGPEVPTPEQEAIIEGAPGGTFRVVAGAGSGKTETMAQRVVWLIANSHVNASGVLGLTFTKKAARELSTRIRSHLATLAQAGIGVGPTSLWAPPCRPTTLLPPACIANTRLAGA